MSESRSVLITDLPGGLEKALTGQLIDQEQIFVKLKGAFKEALVCTDRRVIIIKAGFMTGNTFGSDLFQMPYGNVAGAQVNKHLLTGYFEISAGGVQNQSKSFWQGGKSSPEKSPNCVSLNRQLFSVFGEAAKFIMNRVHTVHAGNPPESSPSAADGPALIEKLAAMKERGLLTEAEFAEKKAQILARM